MNTHRENKLKVCSILTALYLCLFYINSIVKINGIGYVTIYTTLLISILAIKQRWIIIYREWVLAIIFILFIYSISILRLGWNCFTLDYLLHFVSFGVIGMLLGMQEIRINYFAKCMICIGLVGMPRILYLYRGMSNDSNPVVMGGVYAMLPLLLSSFMGRFYNGRYKFAGLILGAMIFFLYFKIGSRGVIVASAIYIILLLYYQIYVKRRKTNIAIMPIILVVLGLWGAIYFLFNLTDIIQIIVWFLDSKFGLHIYALDKILFYALVKQDVLNGRGELWVNAWKMAQDHIIIGNGIGYYEMVHAAYPHNLILQAVNEAGILFAVPLIVIILRSIVWLLFSKTSAEKYYFTSLVFVSGIMPLLFSSSYWFMNPFWIFLGYMIKQLKGNQVRIYATEENKQYKGINYSWRTHRI